MPRIVSPGLSSDRNTAWSTDWGQKSGSSTAASGNDVRKMSGAVAFFGIQETASVTKSVFVALWKKALSATGPASCCQ